MDYKNIMTSIANDIAKKIDRPGPHDWHDAEMARTIILESCLLEVGRCQVWKEDPRNRTMSILVLDARVGMVVDHLNEVERQWYHAQNNYTPEKFAEFGRQGGFVSSENKLVKRHDSDLKSSGELDPTGITADTPGAKLDQGKLLAGLVLGDFSHALEEVVKVGTFGANKYSKAGWLKVSNGIERYMDALHRHLLKHNQGESLDPDSNLTHWAHICWNVLAIMELWERKAKHMGQEDKKKRSGSPQGESDLNYKLYPNTGELEGMEKPLDDG